MYNIDVVPAYAARSTDQSPAQTLGNGCCTTD